jgi:Flp pilus assembly pilin Flp
MHRAFGYVHARLLQLRSENGQGTVEYVALILLVALVMAGVIAAMKGFKTSQGQDLGDAILSKIRSAVDKVEF